MYENPQAICSNPAQAVPKGNDYRLVGDVKAVRWQSGPVAAPPMLLKEQASAFAGAALFMTDGGSEPRLLVKAAGCEFAGIVHVCDTEGSV